VEEASISNAIFGRQKSTRTFFLDPLGLTLFIILLFGNIHHQFQFRQQNIFNRFLLPSIHDPIDLAIANLRTGQVQTSGGTPSSGDCTSSSSSSAAALDTALACVLTGSLS
jgi:hypothetical protein